MRCSSSATFSLCTGRRERRNASSLFHPGILSAALSGKLTITAKDLPNSVNQPEGGSVELIAEATGARQFLAYLDHIGLDERALDLGEIDPALRKSTAPMAIAARLAIDLMEAAAEFLQRPDLGVHFAGWLDPHGFGPLGLLGENCTTFADRFRLARRYVHLQNNALSFDQVRDRDDVVVLCAVHPVLRPRARQYTEAIVAHSVRNARSLLGSRWDPVRIEFAHAAPLSISTQKRYFRCPVHYQSDRDAFVVASSDFHRRLPQGNQETAAFLEKHLASQEDRWPANLRGQVENLIAAQLAGGGVSLARIAALLAVSPRTLQRRLADQGDDFGTILSFVRVQVVRTQLAQKPPPTLARLCHLLGYSEPSAASRFIKIQMGKSARSILHESRVTHRPPPAREQALG
jgi:AraC-like DNA-binding protein